MKKTGLFFAFILLLSAPATTMFAPAEGTGTEEGGGSNGGGGNGEDGNGGGSENNGGRNNNPPTPPAGPKFYQKDGCIDRFTNKWVPLNALTNPSANMPLFKNLHNCNPLLSKFAALGVVSFFVFTNKYVQKGIQKGLDVLGRNSIEDDIVEDDDITQTNADL